jgi:L-seryl-tRNA(Ser) seleniumtransferase
MPRSASPSRPNADPYERLGVRPYINCCGSRTVFGGSLMPERVLAAFNAAATRFALVPELAEAAGKRIAATIGAPAALVTSGGSGSLFLAAAGAVTGGDPENIMMLPRVDGMPHIILTPRGSRFSYDQAMRAVGAEIIEVPDVDALERALSDKVAMIALLGTADPTSPIKVEAAVAAVRGRNIPVFVDAASERLKRPEPYLARGADLVAYSGGKYLCGPQSTGLLIGDARWIHAAWLNAAPHHAIGRHLKVSKEEIAALVAAVDLWAETRDDAADDRFYAAELEAIIAAAARHQGVRGTLLPPTGPAEPTPLLRLSWDRANTGLDGYGLMRALAEGEPRVILDDRGASEDSIVIMPFNLKPGEGAVVGSCIAKALAASKPSAAPRTAASALDVSGTWDVDIALPAGAMRHVFEIAQQGSTLQGLHRMSRLANPISGALSARAIQIVCSHPSEGNVLKYRFAGEIDRDVMHGTVELGTRGDITAGPINGREYGVHAWSARRRG